MDMVKAKVIGASEIAGVAHGGTVELDPAEVNIDALVVGGHIKLVPAAKPARGDEPGKAAG